MTKVFDSLVQFSLHADESVLLKRSDSKKRVIQQSAFKNDSVARTGVNIVLFNDVVKKQVLSSGNASSDLFIAHTWISSGSRMLFDEGLKKDMVAALLVHPYLQQISSFKNIKESAVFQTCVELKIPIILSTAVGSRSFKKVDLVAFAAELTEHCRDQVVIFSHFGGLFCNQFMLLADAFENVMFETSFSLSFWKGSSIEIDQVFCLAKLGSQRFLFGSDFPFADPAKEFDQLVMLMERAGFSDEDQNRVLHTNALSLFGMRASFDGR